MKGKGERGRGVGLDLLTVPRTVSKTGVRH